MLNKCPSELFRHCLESVEDIERMILASIFHDVGCHYKKTKFGVPVPKEHIKRNQLLLV